MINRAKLSVTVGSREKGETSEQGQGRGRKYECGGGHMRGFDSLCFPQREGAR